MPLATTLHCTLEKLSVPNGCHPAAFLACADTGDIPTDGTTDGTIFTNSVRGRCMPPRPAGLNRASLITSAGGCSNNFGNAYKEP